MIAFVTEHFLEILFGLISAGALAFCKYLSKELKNYKALLEKQENEDLNEAIETRLQPVKEEIEELRKHIIDSEEANRAHLDLIISSYRFRLVQLCRLYLQQEYMTQEQYDQLTEFYKVYHGLGGNSQAQEYYEKVMELPIRHGPQK